jgi:hypothetical protein
MVSSCSGVPCCVIDGWFNGNQLMVDFVAHCKGLFPSSFVDSGNYLGVTINKDLTWTKHINQTIGKASKTLGFLRRNLGRCTTKTKATAPGGIPIEDCLAGLLHSLGSCPGSNYRQSELPPLYLLYVSRGGNLVWKTMETIPCNVLQDPPSADSH